MLNFTSFTSAHSAKVGLIIENGYFFFKHCLEFLLLEKKTLTSINGMIFYSMWWRFKSYHHLYVPGETVRSKPGKASPCWACEVSSKTLTGISSPKWQASGPSGGGRVGIHSLTVCFMAEASPLLTPRDPPCLLPCESHAQGIIMQAERTGPRKTHHWPGDLTCCRPQKAEEGVCGMC